METITLSRPRAAELFAEWERRYREEPEAFMSDVQRYTETTPATYGELCAAHFFALNRMVP